ncbi:MAG: amidohydrolase [Deltaproteobacteria bacterium]
MMRHGVTASLLGFLLLASGCFAGAAQAAAEEGAELRVFVAKKIITMDPSQPSATAVAIRGDRIVSVGDLESLKPWLDAHSWELDETYKDSVLLPGLIDPHLHPMMAALILPMEFATPLDWNLPGRTIRGIQGQEAYRARLAELAAAAEPGEPLFVWGYLPSAHGPLTRADLDKITSERPLIAWHRSFHEIIVNTKALAFFDIKEADVAELEAADWQDGHFFETGLMAVAPKIMPVLAAPARVMGGLAALRQVIHAGGITTIADMAAGGFARDLEFVAIRAAFDNEQTPFRTFLVLDGNSWGRELGNAKALAKAEAMQEANTNRIQTLPNIKLFADGAFFSQLVKLGPPGYIDGHEGEWLMTPEALEEAARLYWNAGYQIHVHANGDAGIGVTLDVLEKLQEEKPRPDHRFTIEHFGYSTPSQSRRLATLGAQVSANPWYIYALGDNFAREGLGRDRAEVISRLGALRRNGVRVALHSDFTMAPAEPLRLAWAAANRETAAGEVFAAREKLSLDDAMRAITIDAAWILGREDEIGSIVAGKKADFTALDQDPWEVGASGLKDLVVQGTVFEGRAYPLVEGSE